MFDISEQSSRWAVIFRPGNDGLRHRKPDKVPTDLEQLNYNHLHYFWVVATEGSVTKAAELLHVTPQTISGQLRSLEERLGAPLFRKAGRRMELTETGQVALSYADPMFELGTEMRRVLKHGVLPNTVRFARGDRHGSAQAHCLSHTGTGT